MKKRLVVCCDGTWNRPDSVNVTNVEKIARTISTETTSEGVQQLVLYLSGVGTSGYTADRWLGGAFGLGLFDNVRSGYRWLALNYDPGDEIFVFGFSRGAYTARSMVGMIGKVGLLTRESLIANQLPEAVDRYRGLRPDLRSYYGSSDKRFREVNSHAGVTVQFLGVFDTVGALGVPGTFRRRHRFHDVRLCDAVLCARQALAIDEHRMKFEPSLWEDPDEFDDPLAVQPGGPRVKQVWFEGTHSDVGGGYGETGLSDTALEWMVGEARIRGLRFDERLLHSYVCSGSAAIRHDSLTPGYRWLNFVSRVRLRVRPFEDGPHFLGHERALARGRAVGVQIASSAATHYRDDCDVAQGAGASHGRDWYRPRNIAHFHEETGGFEQCEELVTAHP